MQKRHKSFLSMALAMLVASSAILSVSPKLASADTGDVLIQKYQDITLALKQASFQSPYSTNMGGYYYGTPVLVDQTPSVTLLHPQIVKGTDNNYYLTYDFQLNSPKQYGYWAEGSYKVNAQYNGTIEYYVNGNSPAYLSLNYETGYSSWPTTLSLGSGRVNLGTVLPTNPSVTIGEYVPNANFTYNGSQNSFRATMPGAASTTYNLQPAYVTVSNITASGAKLSWDPVPGATQYVISDTGSISAEPGHPVEITSNTFYNLTGLKATTNYYYWVIATNSSGVISQHTVNFSTNSSLIPPNAPTNLVATNVTSNSAQIQWAPVSGVVSYNVYDGNGNKLNTSPITGSSFALTGLSLSKPMSIQVTSVDGNGTESDLSYPITVSPPLSAPVGVTASNITTNSAQIQWTSETGAASYNIYNANGTKVNTYPINGSSFALAGLNPGTTTGIQVTAVDASGNESPKSTIVTINTALVAPTGLTASNITTNSAQIQWTPDTGAAAYNIYNGNGTKLNTGPINGTSFALTGLNPGSTTSIQVTAVDASGNESPKSSVFNLTTGLAAPIGLTASNITTNSAQIQWTPDNGAASYNIYDGTGKKLNASSISGTSFSLTGLSSGTSMSITVTAVDSSGKESGKSTPINLTTLKAAGPSSVSVSKVTTTSADLSWDNEQWMSGYNIYLNGVKQNSGLNTTNVFHLSGLKMGTQYTVGVTGVDSNGNETTASNVQVKTASSLPAPTNVTAMNTTTTSSTIHWNTVANAAGYRVYLDNTLQNETPVNTTSFDLTNLSPNTTRTVTVTAVDASGTESVPSAPYTLLTPSSDLMTPTFANFPDKNGVSLLINSITANPTGFVISRAPNLSSDFTDVNTVDLASVTPAPQSFASTYDFSNWLSTQKFTKGQVISATVAGKTDYFLYDIDVPVEQSGQATTYQYEAKTVISANDVSIASKATNVTMPAAAPNAPTNANAAWQGNNVVLKWDANGNTAPVVYNVLRQSQGSTTWQTIASNLQTTTYTDGNVPSGNYQYEIVAAVPGSQQNSSSITVSTTGTGGILANVTNARQTNSDSKSISLAWNYPNGANATNVYINVNGSWYLVGQEITTSVTIKNGMAVTDATVVGNTFVTGKVDTLTLSPATKYQVALQAFNTNTEQASGYQTVNANTTGVGPAAPTGFTATANGQNVTLAWRSESGVLFYKFQRTDAAGNSVVVTVPSSSTNYTDSNLDANATYSYSLYAFNSNGPSDAATANVTSGVNQTAPTPQNVSATQTNSGVVVKWDAVQGATRYGVQRVDATGKVQFTDYFSAGTTGFTDSNPTGVVKGATYTYKVYATTNGSNWSGTPGTATWTYQDASAAVIPTPQNVSATQTNTGVVVKWDAVQGATRYGIQRVDASGKVQFTQYVTAGTTSFTDTNSTGVVRGGTYTYNVFATTDGTNWSTIPGTATWTYQDPNAGVNLTPQNVSATQTSTGVSVKWDSVQGSTKYEVQRVDANGKVQFTQYVPAGTTSYTDTNGYGVVKGGTYTYNVYATTDGTTWSSSPGTATWTYQ